MDKKKEGTAIIERLMQAFHAACPHARKGCNALGDWCGIPGYKLRRVKNGESVLSLEDLHVISSRTGLTPDRISLAQGAEHTPAEGSDVVIPFGKPAMRNEKARPAASPGHDLPQGPCLRCQALERELELERAERRELAQELRDANHQLRQLLQENGDLRARLAHLEGRAGIRPGAPESSAADSA